MMKIFIIFFLCLTFLNAEANEKWKLGLGAMVGEPTAVSAQVRTSEKILSTNVGTSLHAEPTFLLDVKFLFPELIPRLIRKPSSPIIFYGGIGGFMKIENDVGSSKLAMGGRFPLGLDYIIPQKKLGLFLEATPVVRIVTYSSIEMMAGFGIHYYFH
jgi:hypothetical protein